MKLTLSNVSPLKNATLIEMLLLTVFGSACALSIKAAYDLTKDSKIFPAWFVPSFIATIIILMALSLYFVLQARKTENPHPFITSKQSVILWILMLLSYICTTSVHGFYPFHRNTLSILPVVDLVMKINYVLAITGFILCCALAGIYIFSSMKPLASMGLLIMALITLIPNDNCANPFNYWWIEKIGASPLMYVPNMYAALFVTCGLYGIHPKAIGFLTACICVGSLLLGIGHQLGIIW